MIEFPAQARVDGPGRQAAAGDLRQLDESADILALFQEVGASPEREAAMSPEPPLRQAFELYMDETISEEQLRRVLAPAMEYIEESERAQSAL